MNFIIFLLVIQISMITAFSKHYLNQSGENRNNSRNLQFQQGLLQRTQWQNPWNGQYTLKASRKRSTSYPDNPEVDFSPTSLSLLLNEPEMNAVGTFVTSPITTPTWFYSPNSLSYDEGKGKYRQNRFKNFDDLSYLNAHNSVKGDQEKTDAISAGIALLCCLTLVASFLSVPVLLGILLSLALILTFPVPVITMGLGGRNGLKKVTRNEVKVLQDKIEQVMDMLPKLSLPPIKLR